MPHRNGTGIELLADPTRRQIVAMLALRPQRSSDLALGLARSRPAASRHLRLLLDAGLVLRRPMPIDRRGRLYSIHPMRHGAITAWLAGTEVGRSFGEGNDVADRARESAVEILLRDSRVR
jgi:DNA-binding transcriptional ArsR family regulator